MIKPKKLYVKLHGKFIEVTGIFDTAKEANSYLEKNPEEGVIYCGWNEGTLIYTANNKDLGK